MGFEERKEYMTRQEFWAQQFSIPAKEVISRIAPGAIEIEMENVAAASAEWADMALVEFDKRWPYAVTGKDHA